MLQKQSHWPWNVLNIRFIQKTENADTLFNNRNLVVDVQWFFWLQSLDVWLVAFDVLQFGRLDMLKASDPERQAIEAWIIAHQW